MRMRQVCRSWRAESGRGAEHGWLWRARERERRLLMVRGREMREARSCCRLSQCLRLFLLLQRSHTFDVLLSRPREVLEVRGNDGLCCSRWIARLPCERVVEAGKVVASAEETCSSAPACCRTFPTGSCRASSSGRSTAHPTSVSSTRAVRLVTESSEKVVLQAEQGRVEVDAGCSAEVRVLSAGGRSIRLLRLRRTTAVPAAKWRLGLRDESWDAFGADFVDVSFLQESGIFDWQRAVNSQAEQSVRAVLLNGEAYEVVLQELRLLLDYEFGLLLVLRRESREIGKVERDGVRDWLKRLRHAGDMRLLGAHEILHFLRQLALSESAVRLSRSQAVYSSAQSQLSLNLVLLIRSEAVLYALVGMHQLEPVPVRVVELPELGIVVKRKRTTRGKWRSLRRTWMVMRKSEGVLVLEQLASSSISEIRQLFLLLLLLLLELLLAKLQHLGCRQLDLLVELLFTLLRLFHDAILVVFENVLEGVLHLTRLLGLEPSDVCFELCEILVLLLLVDQSTLLDNLLLRKLARSALDFLRQLLLSGLLLRRRESLCGTSDQ
ncbi:hypothetical protein AAT19DRAFT_12796 [Rhodotorula toruloides]|uniref:Uncharacterized protein n=1 Tax=Rhodotorula toruloides TaxID=5286 RepID=A0A2T0ACS6_RHOTO|nr:hypothetical protein AAT19DRAFT_12796 [Rhodotorula toruloides]